MRFWNGDKVKKIKHRLEYALLKSVESALCALPLPLAIRGGELLGRFMSVALGKRRNLIIDNLERAFPQKDRSEIERIARASWENLGRTALEFVRSSDFVGPGKSDRVKWEGVEEFERALEKGRGLVLVAMHFTNWELLGMLIQDRFKKMMAIARPMKNPYAEDWLKSKRAQGGMKITLHRDAVKASLRWLKSKNIVGILVDQNLYHGGVFVNFFGRPAATTTLPALLHVRTGAPVFITYSLREGDSFRAVLVPVGFPEVVDEEQRLRVYTQIINDCLERVISVHPENWFWIHNRWKRAPDPTPVS
jgi:KDO2-lipid IV(A) lauroyltransferase